MKKILLLFILLSSTLMMKGQCLYSGSTEASTTTFCIDNSNTTTTNIKAGQYATVNVISGFTYTFSVGNINTTTSATENLTLFNGSSNAFIAGGYSSGATSASINYTATFSGQVKVLYSSGSCTSTDVGTGTMTLTLNSVGNTIDSQTAFGTNQWVGHVYNHVVPTSGLTPGGTTSPSSPSTTVSPFLPENYVGYYNVTAETINEGFGGSYACFPVYSDGVIRTNLYTEVFSVRYRMKSTRAAGCYFLNVNGDDGVRVYVDGVLVVDNWKQQGNTYYCNNIITLNGNSDIILDYYEHNGGNVVGFSLTPFDASSNIITSQSNVSLCSGATTTINANALSTCTANTGTSYQWQVSTDNTTFTNISGATSQNYTPPAQTTTGAAVVRYYRRNLVLTVTNSASCSYATSSVKVTTSLGVPSGSGTITGSSIGCAPSTATYTVSGYSNASNYIWSTTNSTWTLTPSADGTSVSVTLPSTATSGNLVVTPTNGCGTGTNTTTRNITVVPQPTAASISAPTSICLNDNGNVAFTNPQNYAVNIKYTINNGSTQTVYVNANATTNVNIPASTATTYTYQLTSIENNSQNYCSAPISGSATVTVNPRPSQPTTLTINGNSNSPFCPNTTATFVVSGSTNATGYTWTLPNGWSIVSGQGSNTIVATTGSASQSGNVVVKPLNGASCPGYSDGSFYVGLTATAPTPTFTSQPGATTCATIGTKYTTQSGQTNYIWSIPGVAGTDYTITSGGISSTDNSVSLTWITTGNKTVTVQYTSGCASTTAASNTTNVLPVSSIASVTGTSPLCVGDTATYTANGVVLGGGTGAWSSSNDLIATVNASTGLVTAVSNGYVLIRYAITGGCTTNPQAQQGLNINVATKGGTMTGGTSICLGSSSPTLTLTGYTGTILKWQASVSPFTTWTDIANTTPTKSGLTPTENTRYRAVVQSGTCSIKESDYTTVTVTNPATPTVGTIVQPTCTSPLGSIQLSGLPLSGTINQTGTAVQNIAVTSTTMTISNLAAGSYNFKITDSGCTSVQTGNVILNPITTNTWSGAWSTGSAPTLNQNVIFSADYTLNTDIDACTCTVNSGKNVSIKSTKTMKVQNEVTIIGSGTLTFEDSGSLVQINDAALNTGSITYKRNTTEITNFDYTYWSSPVQGQVLQVLSPDTFYDKFYSFDAAGNAWKLENRANTMTVGKGYIIRGPEYFKSPAVPGFFGAVFYGKPNNGIVNVTAGGANSINFIGNPYPSSIDADTFLTQNSSVIGGTVYFWTHNTAIQLASNIEAGKAGSGNLAYTSDDYASYNFTGGTATATTAISTTGASAGKIPTGKIAAGQGFLAIGKSTSTIVFNNSMRLKTDGTALTNNQFFRPSASSKTAKITTTVEKNRLWLNLSNEQGAFKQLLIGYITGATNDFDSAYDGYTFNANSFINFYSINDKNNFSIQGRAVDTQKSDIVPLGYSSTIEGPFSISIDQTDGTLSDQEIILEDKLTLATHDLQQGAYSFTTAAGTFDDRFVITYKTKATLATDDFETDGNLVYATQTANTIDIHSQSELISEVALYDISGKLLLKKTGISAKEVSFSKISKSAHVLLFKIKLENGQIITKKVLQQFN